MNDDDLDGQLGFCSECGRRWVELGGVREPITEDIDLEYGDPDGECLVCGGDW